MQAKQNKSTPCQGIAGLHHTEFHWHLVFYSNHMGHHMEHSLGHLGSDVPAVSSPNSLNTSSSLSGEIRRGKGLDSVHVLPSNNRSTGSSLMLCAAQTQSMAPYSLLWWKLALLQTKPVLDTVWDVPLLSLVIYAFPLERGDSLLWNGCQCGS